ncbi:hypothetical protein E0K89_006180 [Aquicoccus sp. SCR17]|nr:hypothetical protein [Carideicomes alvinocaridis]
MEIALDPPELGRVRMHLSTGEQALVLQISADRPETLEMMRRHIQDLGGAFRDLGYAEVEFSFGERGGGASRPDQENDPGEAIEDRKVRMEPAATPGGAPIPERAAEGGLDLRL